MVEIPTFPFSSLIRYLTLRRVSHLQTFYITNVSSEEEPRHFSIYHYITVYVYLHVFTCICMYLHIEISLTVHFLVEVELNFYPIEKVDIKRSLYNKC